MNSAVSSVVASVGAVLLLSACVTAGGETVRPLSTELASGARVSTITLVGVPGEGVSDTFDTDFRASIQSELNQCATGTQLLNLQVTLDQFDRANPAQTWLITDANRVSGVARLTDASGAVVGEYRIERSLRMGGVLGVVALAQAEEQMGRAFGDELCKRAFGRD